MAYTKNIWNTGDVITKAKLDIIENGISANDASNTAQDGKITTLEGKTKNATTSVAGIVKQSANVAKVVAEDAIAVADTPTKAEVDKIVTLANANKVAINKLIDELIKAGIIAGA